MNIVRYKSFVEIQTRLPELYEATMRAKHEILEALSPQGIDSLAFGEKWIGELSHVGWTYCFEGLTRSENNKVLYEDHPHESAIRYEFRITWRHPKHQARGDIVGQIVRETFNKLRHVKNTATMYGHYGAEVSSMMVLVWINRV